MKLVAERAKYETFLAELDKNPGSKPANVVARVRADLAGSAYAEALPAAFSVGDAEGSVRDGLRQVSKLWSKVNAIAPAPAGVILPLKLPGVYALDQFDADRELLRKAYRALSDAEVELNLARGERNVLQDAIYEVLKTYRLKVPTAVTAGSPLLDTLPALTPPPGRTPAAVKAHAAWDATSGMARLTWDASTESDLKHYEVRAVAGDSYTTDDEVTLATVAANGVRELMSDFALDHPRLTVGYKVYVVLTTGNEKGSEALYVTRPA